MRLRRSRPDPSPRSVLLRQRIELVERLSLHPYLQAVLSFSLAAGAEALRSFETAGRAQENRYALAIFDAVASGSERHETVLAVAGWAYAARVAEITWPDRYEGVLEIVTSEIHPDSEPERRVLAHGRAARAGERHGEAHVRFQRTVVAALAEAALGSAPEGDPGALGLWLLAWTDGWATFGRLQGQYFPRTPPFEQLAGVPARRS